MIENPDQVDLSKKGKSKATFSLYYVYYLLIDKVTESRVIM